MNRQNYIIALVILLVIVAVIALRKLIEPMSGYAIASGLAFQNNARYCFKNPHDPPDYPGYCTNIGRVVI